jgi:hypothetical protein
MKKSALTSSGRAHAKRVGAKAVGQFRHEISYRWRDWSGLPTKHLARRPPGNHGPLAVQLEMSVSVTVCLIAKSLVPSM